MAAASFQSGSSSSTSTKNNENTSFRSKSKRQQQAEKASKTGVMNEVVTGNEVKSGMGTGAERDVGLQSSSDNATQSASTSSQSHHNPPPNEEKKKKKQQSKKERPSKAQMKQSSLESNDMITMGRENSWKKKISERTVRSRSLEEDFGDNTNATTTGPITTPADADLIEDRLFLGNKDAACNIRWLKQQSITHILTIDSCPLPTKITDLPFITTKYLQVSDMPQEDILHYFEQTNHYISQAICKEQTPGNILVHCYYGVSRSATIVLAYLMHTYKISLEEALERVTSKREGVGPNHGFLSQLRLYEKMGYRIDRNCPIFKRFRLYMAAIKMKSVKVLPPPYTDVVRPDPCHFSVRPEPVVYRCKKCRRVLASGSNLLLHKEGKTPRWAESLADKVESTASVCTQMYFIEPIVWMREAGHSLQGKLHCPNALCKSKLGSFSWVLGCLCPCGAKVQPAFYLVPSKIDRSNSVLNLQITL